MNIKQQKERESKKKEVLGKKNLLMQNIMWIGARSHWNQNTWLAELNAIKSNHDDIEKELKKHSMAKFNLLVSVIYNFNGE